MNSSIIYLVYLTRYTDKYTSVNGKSPSQLPAKLNELDNNGDLALDLALSRKLESIATTLVNNKADVDMVDQSGWSLLHKAIQRGMRGFDLTRSQ